jgi:two-component system, NarL family, nitrate/nitrite response regulator NarL
VAVSVVVADDHPLFREGIAERIQRTDGLTLVAAVGDGSEALHLIDERDPDVAILGVDMPGRSALDVLRAVTRRRLRTRIIVLTGSVQGEALLDALDEGARGYLVKTDAWDRFAAAIATVADGGMHVDPGLAAHALKRRQQPRPSLTERETAILTLLAKGYTAEEAGREMHIATATVRKAMTSAYAKLGVTGQGKSAAVAEALRRELIV